MSDRVITPKMRREFLRGLPWVTYVGTAVPCDGHRWGRVPLRALYPWGPGQCNPPLGLDRWRCRNAAHWRFRALRRLRRDDFGPADDGTYCMAHLFSQFHHNGSEDRRASRAWDEFLTRWTCEHSVAPTA